jgi:AraC-like DNA-binding protein
MQDFHLIKASQARPFALFLQDKGAPVEQLAVEAGLPLAAVWGQNHSIIGEFALWQFVEAGARSKNCELLGYECAQSHPINLDNHLGDLPLRFGSNLERTLNYFNEDILQLSTACYYSLDRRSGDCWFRRVQAFGRERASWQTELYTVAILLQVIQIHAGQAWLPTQIRFSARKEPQSLPSRWKDLSVEWGAEATGIQLPDAALALPPRQQRKSQRRKQQGAQRPHFRQLVATQVSTCCIGIDNAAKQTGISVSTLQRILKASNTTYQEILDEVRHDMARDLLEKTPVPVTDIASGLGYDHPGNFSRAFVRWEGISPAAYRTRGRQ